MEPSKRVPPYLPFKTFLSSLDVLSHGVPPKLDRTLWRSQSGVTQGLIMNAYRFFGLVDDEPDASDSSTDHLDKMAKHPDKRPEVLRFLIECQYDQILAKHDLTKMTLKMLEDAFDREFSVSGGTKQKAITFFSRRRNSQICRSRLTWYHCFEQPGRSAAPASEDKRMELPSNLTSPRSLLSMARRVHTSFALSAGAL